MCVLRVTSSRDSFAAFLARTSLPVYESHEKGDVQTIRTRMPPHEDYGFKCNVSDKGFDDLKGQVEDAIAFLSRHRDELLELSRDHQVDDIRLDFPYSCRLHRVAAQCEYLPPALLRAAGELGIGIEMSLYPSSGEDET
jgi:hypothetical protein